ncbi:MAG TPA: hypothetical protein VHN20_14340 [Beijerinckiaceae bacterium]|nr:hypothetical protein [Beijerinckiaceae bacterium]
MATMKKLARFAAEPSDGGARLTIEAEDGATFEIEADFDQLEDLADTLDDILSANEDALEVKDEAST